MPLARLSACLFALLLAVAAAPRTADAQSPIFTVSGVEVDVTAGSAAAARTQAIDNGHQKAFQRLVARLVPENRVDNVPQLTADELANYVRDFEVFDERTSNVRYLASLTFRFQPQAVRRFLRQNDIPFAETRSKPVVVLPVWGKSENAVLWDDPNPWRQAWAKKAEQPVLVPLTVPLGDLSDIRSVDVEQALAPDEAALAEIAGRYNANDVLVTQARVAGDPEAGTASMQVISMRVGTPALERTLVDNVQQQVDETLPQMLARAVDGVVRDIEESWKRANLLRFEQQSSLAVEVPLDSLQRWVTVRERLNTVAQIDGMAVDLLSRQQANLELSYFGELEQLRVALLQADLVLEKVGSTEVNAPSSNQSQWSGSGTVETVDAAATEVTWRLRAAEMTIANGQSQSAADGSADTAASDGGTSGGDSADGLPEGVEVQELSRPEGAGANGDSGTSGSAGAQ